MAVVYFDASAFVKLLVDEDGSEVAEHVWNTADAAFSNRLSYPEVSAALAAMRRNHQLDDQAHDRARRAWSTLWATTWPVGITEGVEQLAGDLARTRALRGADAVHLASALSLEHSDFVLAAWDERLRRAALSEGLAVVPAVV